MFNKCRLINKKYRSLAFLTQMVAIGFLFSALLVSCRTIAPVVPDRAVDIDISNLSSRYIDLAAYPGDTLVIGGKYTGDRIVLKNASHKVLLFQQCELRSTHPEDALVIAENPQGLELLAADLSLHGGGITFWGQLTDVKIIGARIDSTHTGIRATSDRAHRRVIIENCYITNTTHEGIYLGVSKDSPTKAANFYVENNRLENCGWDAIQVGNVTSFVISGNQIERAGFLKEYGQDYGITINPGSLGYLYNNEIKNTAKPIQVLDSRVFFHTR